MDCVKQNKGCPAFVSSDCGTENTVVAGLHCYFHKSIESHRYVKSTSNQRIEAFWCQLRRNRVEFYMDFFRTLSRDGVLNKDDCVEM